MPRFGGRGGHARLDRGTHRRRRRRRGSRLYGGTRRDAGVRLWGARRRRRRRRRSHRRSRRNRRRFAVVVVVVDVVRLVIVDARVFSDAGRDVGVGPVHRVRFGRRVFCRVSFWLFSVWVVASSNQFVVVVDVVVVVVVIRTIQNTQLVSTKRHRPNV